MPCNFVNAYLGHQCIPYKALIDTGASVCVCRYDLLRRHGFTVEPVSERIQKTLLAADQTPLVVKGKSVITIRIGDFVADVEFIAVQRLQYPLIIGMNMLQKYKACIDMDGPCLTIGDDRTTVPMMTRFPNNQILRVCEDMDLPPMHEAFIKVALPQGFDPCVSVIEALQNPWKSDGILVARICVKPVDRFTVCRVINVSEEVICVRKNRAIATITAMQADDLMLLDRDNDDATDDIQTDDETSDSAQTDSKTHEQMLAELQSMGLKIEPENVTAEEKRELVALLFKYREVFSEQIPGVRGFEYNIELKDGKLPPRGRQNYYNPAMQEIVDEELDKWEKKGIIKRDEFVHAPPLLLIRKKCGCTLKLKGDKGKRGDNSATLDDCPHPATYRLASDFRALNSCVVQTPFSPPNIETLTDHFRQKGQPPAKYFTIFDALQGYLQLKLDHPSSRLCGIETPSGSYAYQFMPLGLICSGDSYNRLMAKIIGSMKLLNCLNYVDDIVLFSDTHRSHAQSLETLLKRLAYYRLRIKGTKCQIMKSEVQFVGLRLNGLGIKPDERKCELISRLKSPTNQRMLRSFLSLMSYFRKFIYRFSDHVAIFSPLLKKNSEWKWESKHEKQFVFLKELLKKEPILLNHPQWQYPFKVVTDASAVAASYILLNETPEGDKVILYGSRLWSDTERRHHCNRLELAAICHAVTRLHRYLAFRKFTIITDNISSSFVKSLHKQRGPLFRLGMTLSNYNFEIIHRAGDKNPSDYVSRSEITGDETTPDDNHVTIDDEMVMPISSVESPENKETCVLAINWHNKTAGYRTIELVDSDKCARTGLTVNTIGDIVFTLDGNDQPATATTEMCNAIGKSNRVRFEKNPARKSDVILPSTEHDTDSDAQAQTQPNNDKADKKTERRPESKSADGRCWCISAIKCCKLGSYC